MFKKKSKYWVLKLYRAVNISESKSFDFKEISLQNLSFFEELNFEEVFDIEINYGIKSWKKTKDFKRFFQTIDNSDITELTFFGEKSCIYFSLCNSLMNYESPDFDGFIELEVAFCKEKFDENIVELYLKEVITDYNFDYGFAIETFSRNSPFTEKNENLVRKGKLPNFLFYSIGVNHGFIKDVYSLNLLNRSHMKLPEIKELLSNKIGRLYKFNDHLSILKLNDEEMRIAKEKLYNTKYVIVNDKNPNLFLKSTEAEQFYDQRKIN